MGAVVSVKGTERMQGIAQGQALRREILGNIEEVKKKMKKDQVDVPRYERFVERNAAFLRENHRELWEEMEGIGQGAGIPMEEILLLNIPAYFMTGYLNQECSMILARGRATADHLTYLVKNRDMSTYISQAVIEKEYQDGVKIVEINGAGTVTYPAGGMNSFGLGAVTTGFWSKEVPPDLEEADSSHIFVNIHLLLRACKTAREGLEYLKSSPRMNGLNVILADSRDAFLVEMTRDAVWVEEDRGDGILWRTNHYLSPEFSRLNPGREEYPSTFCRYERLRTLLKEREGAVRFQDLFRMMSDHENGGNAVCRHPSEEFPGWTMATSLFVLEDREAWTVLDNPCKSLRQSKL